MPREHGEGGEFVETITLDDVLGVFDAVDGPVVLSVDVADQLDCSRETARRKLKQLHDRGDLGRRKVARRVIYWRSDDAPQEARERRETASASIVDHTPPPDDDGATAPDIDSNSSVTPVIDDVLEGWPPAGQSKREQRRQAGRAALEWLRDAGEATARDFRDRVEPDHPVEGQSAKTWWRKAARPALKRAQDAGLVGFTEGSKVYTWTGDGE